MAMSDPIADMLTRIRNGVGVKKPVVEIPASKLKRDIAKILAEKGFIKKFVIVDDGKQGIMKVLLRYTNGEPAIQGIERVSRPSRRHYSSANELPKVLNGLGISIVSTSSGVKTDKECRSENVGGEIICNVW